MRRAWISDYSAAAKDYDTLRYLQPDDAFVDGFRRERFRKCLKADRAATVLDVGTGTGSGILFFSKEVGRVIGLDGTRAMLEQAKKKIEIAEIGNADLVFGDAMEMPFRDGSFDVVTCLNFIHLFKPLSRQQQFVREMERVVRGKGSVLIEIDNILYNKELGNHYRDIRRLGTGLRVEEVMGTTLPFTKRIFRLSKRLAGAYLRLPEKYPFVYFCHRWIVRFRKP